MLNSKEFVRELQLRHESAWMNPNVGSADAALAALIFFVALLLHLNIDIR